MNVETKRDAIVRPSTPIGAWRREMRFYDVCISIIVAAGMVAAFWAIDAIGDQHAACDRLGMVYAGNTDGKIVCRPAVRYERCDPARPAERCSP